jgi:hypothetical protein
MKKETYCKAQVGEKLCGNKIYKDEYCRKHYKMFYNELSAERMVILDFNAGALVIRFIPLSMIEWDADEIMSAMEDEWNVRTSDCEYMVVNEYLIDDNTR